MTPPVTTEALVEAGCRTVYGKNWDGPADKAPGEAMQKVWRDLVAKAQAPLLAALQQVTAERDEARADRDDAIRMLDVWFDTSTKTNEQVVPQLVDALVGYLRTCRCGGMPAETSDLIEAGAADFIRRRAGYIIAPVIEAMVAERTASLRAEGEAKDRDNAATALMVIALCNSVLGNAYIGKDGEEALAGHVKAAFTKPALARAATARER